MRRRACVPVADRRLEQHTRGQCTQWRRWGRFSSAPAVPTSAHGIGKISAKETGRNQAPRGQPTCRTQGVCAARLPVRASCVRPGPATPCGLPPPLPILARAARPCTCAWPPHPLDAFAPAPRPCACVLTAALLRRLLRVGHSLRTIEGRVEVNGISVNARVSAVHPCLAPSALAATPWRVQRRVVPRRLAHGVVLSRRRHRGLGLLRRAGFGGVGRTQGCS